MKTENITREPRRAAQSVSRALQDLAPLSCELLDARGRRVPLSSAGYVLRAGNKYRLRVTPADNDLIAVQVISPPDFLIIDPEVTDHDAAGRCVRDIPFRVRLDLGAAVYRFGNVRCDDLEITCKFRPESGKHSPKYCHPVVVRPGLALVSLAAVGSILSLVAPLFLSELSNGSIMESTDFMARISHWLTNPVFWLCLGLIAAVLLSVYGFSLFQLLQRSKELCELFQERYTPSTSKFKIMLPSQDKYEFEDR